MSMLGDLYMFGQDCGEITQEDETKVFFEIEDAYGRPLTARWVDKSKLGNLYFLRKNSKLRLVKN